MSNPVWTPMEGWPCQLLPGDELTLEDLVVHPDGSTIVLLSTGEDDACVGYVCDPTVRFDTGDPSVHTLLITDTVNTLPARFPAEPRCGGGRAVGAYCEGELYTYDPGVARIVSSHGVKVGSYGFPLDTWDGDVPTGFAAGWDQPVAYEVGNVVVVNHDAYICTVAHTSALTTWPGMSDGWDAVWDILDYVPADFMGVSNLAGTADTLYVCDSISKRILVLEPNGQYRDTFGLTDTPRLDPRAMAYRVDDNSLWVMRPGLSIPMQVSAYTDEGVLTQNHSFRQAATGVSVDNHARVCYGIPAFQRKDGQWVVGYVYNTQTHTTVPILIDVNDSRMGGRWYVKWDAIDSPIETENKLYASNGTFVVRCEYGLEEPDFNVTLTEPGETFAGESFTVIATVDGPPNVQMTITLNVYQDTELVVPFATRTRQVLLTPNSDGATWMEVPFDVTTASGASHTYTAIATLTATQEGEAVERTSNEVVMTTTVTWVPTHYTGGSGYGAGRVYVAFEDYRGHPFGWDNPLYNNIVASVNPSTDRLYFAAGDGNILEGDGELGTNVFLMPQRPCPTHDGQYVYIYSYYPGYLYEEGETQYGPEGWGAYSVWYKLNLTTGLLTTVQEPAAGYIFAPTLSADDTWLYYLKPVTGSTARQVWKLNVNTLVEVHVAGDTLNGYSGDGGPATSAKLNVPFDIALGKDGVLYIADTNNKAIRAVATDGTITTVYHDVAAMPIRTVAADPTRPLIYFVALENGNHPLVRWNTDTNDYTVALEQVEDDEVAADVLDRANIQSLSCDAAGNVLITGIYGREAYFTGTAYYAAGPVIYALPATGGPVTDIAGWWNGAVYTGTLSNGGKASETMLGAVGGATPWPTTAVSVGNVLFRPGGLHSLDDMRFGIAREVFGAGGGVYYHQAIDGRTWSMPTQVALGRSPSLTVSASGSYTVTYLDVDGNPAQSVSYDGGRTWSAL